MYAKLCNGSERLRIGNRIRVWAAWGFVMCLCFLTVSNARADDLLGGLARPQEGRSMRASSTFREGKDGKYDPRADPKGDKDEKSNSDNFRVAPGETHVLMDAKGPGLITHIWMTFLGPEAQTWAKNGSANHIGGWWLVVS